jgi:predicted Zn-dependent protease
MRAGCARAWRAQIGDAREAGALLDELIARGADRVEWYVTRAQAHAREGDAPAALAAIVEMMIASGNRPLAPLWQHSAAELLKSLAVEPEWEPWRAGLAGALGGLLECIG